jgi:flagellar basal body-associated protein FliL
VVVVVMTIMMEMVLVMAIMMVMVVEVVVVQAQRSKRNGTPFPFLFPLSPIPLFLLKKCHHSNIIIKGIISIQLSNKATFPFHSIRFSSNI